MASKYFSSGISQGSRVSSKLIWDFRGQGRPWCRERPFPQMTFRSDGKNVRDGAGLGSPAFWFPERVLFDDPLDKVRDFFRTKVSSSGLVGAVSDFLAVPREFQSTSIARIKEICLASADDLAAGLRDTFPELHDISFAPDQPFRLNLIAALACKAGDSDWSFPLRGIDGFHLGSEVPVDDSGLWPIKPFPFVPLPSTGDHGDSGYLLWDQNYSSFRDHFDLAAPKIEVDLANGFAECPGSWEMLCARFGIFPPIPPPQESGKKGLLIGPEGFASARLGAVPQGEGVRVVVDGTVGGVNDACVLPETQQTPGLADLCSGLDPAMPEWVGLKIDVKSAYKRLKLLPSEWRRALFCIDQKWYFYKVMPFGMKASGYWWNRFNGVVHRCLHTLLADICHGGFMYVDDSLWLFRPQDAPLAMAVVLAFLTTLGVPLAWDKQQGGSIVDWVGYEVNLNLRRVSLGADKSDKMNRILSDLMRRSPLPVDLVRSACGFMSWASAVVPTVRPLLWPIFRATYSPDVISRGFVRDVRLLRFSAALWQKIILHAVSFCPRALRCRSSAIIRVDACASSSGAWLGGWFAPHASCSIADIRWFGCEVPPEVFPEKKSKCQFYISAAEMLALAVAINLWGSALRAGGAESIALQSDSMVSVLSCAADYARSPNMSFSLREFVAASLTHDIECEVTHIPGVSNVLADAISRRKRWIWEILPAKNFCEVSIDILCPLARSAFDSSDHNPFAGIVVGQAKNPGPSFASLLISLGMSPPDADAVEEWLGISSLADFRACLAPGAASVADIMESWFPAATPSLSRSVCADFLARALRGAPIATQGPALLSSPSGGGGEGTGPLRVPSPLPRGGSAVSGEALVAFAPPPKRPRSEDNVTAIARWASPPVPGPVPSPKSLDSIVQVKTSKLAKKAVAVARSPASLQAAINDLRRGFYADSTWRSHASEIRIYLEICQSAEVPPFPVSANSLETFAAALQVAGFKASSIQQYLSATLRHQSLSRIPFGEEAEKLVRSALTHINRSLNRGKGDPHHMEPITVEIMRKFQLFANSVQDRMFWDLFCIQWFFLLRGSEVIRLRPCDFAFLPTGSVAAPGSITALEQNVRFFSPTQVVLAKESPPPAVGFRVRIQITRDKTNQQRRDVHRFLDCVCCANSFALGPGALPAMCPVHAAARLLSRHRGPDDSPCNGGVGVSSPSADQYNSSVRNFIGRAGISRFEVINGTQIERFGSHSFRRGGAQALALAGWTLDMIKFFGRWLSNAIELYLLDMPFRAKGHLLASSMVSGVIGTGQDAFGSVPSFAPSRPTMLRLGSRLRVRFPIAPEVHEFFSASSESEALSGDAWFDVVVTSLAGGVVQGCTVWRWEDAASPDVRLLPAGSICPIGFMGVAPSPPPTDLEVCVGLGGFPWFRA